MKGVLEFAKTTLIGGLVFLVPLVVLAVLIGKALQIARKVSVPLSDWIPLDNVAGLALADVLAVAIAVALCFIAGLVAKTSLASRLVGELESRFLSKIPVYTFIKGIADSVTGTEEAGKLRPVVARLDDASQVAFEVERLADGQVVVYIPGAPNPWSGSVMLMTEDRIEPLDLPMAAAVQNLRMLGQGSNELLTARS